jgi:hypothetical protein
VASAIPEPARNFVLGKVHLDVPTSQDAGSLATKWIRLVYIGLITMTIGSMLVHNGLIWRRKALDKRRARGRTVVRMTRNQRLQHFILLSSFGILVLTGFALKYPDSWLGAIFLSSEMTKTKHTPGSRGHPDSGRRLAYRLRAGNGRRTASVEGPAAAVRRISWTCSGICDSTSAKLREAQDRPLWLCREGRVLGGSLGCDHHGCTGLLIWYKVEAFSFLPRWSVDVALAIHFYEAILATLAIVVWHFYQVIFDPDVYPINWAWWDGQMSEKLFHEEHPLAYEQMQAPLLVRNLPQRRR